MRRMLKYIVFAFVLAFVATTPHVVAHAEPQINANAGFECRAVGIYQASQGASWTDLTYTAFDYVTSTSAGSTSILVALTITNTHASQTLYLLLKANGSEATTAAIPIAAGASLSLPGLMGSSTTAISIQGSGASTTADIVSYWW